MNIRVSRKNLDLFAIGLFENYCWGLDIFYFTMELLKGRIVGKDEKLHDRWFYHLDGYPYTFQVWFYECCPYVIGEISNFSSGDVPYILNWTCNRTPSSKVLQCRIFHESAAKVIFFYVHVYVYVFFIV